MYAVNVKLVFVEMSLKRSSSCVSNVPKIKKICSDSSLEIAKSSENVVTSSRIDEAVEGDIYILTILAVVLICLCFYFFLILTFFPVNFVCNFNIKK